MKPLELVERRHPDPAAGREYAGLVGIDSHKQALLSELVLALDPGALRDWCGKHHPQGLAAAEDLLRRPPAVLLSGEVGCGKTALARSVGTPLAERLDQRVIGMEAPTDLRGSGLVGEISARITAAFDQARRRVGSKHLGLLILDEVDDLGTARAQEQAHHEDRAGLNALIRQMDGLPGHDARLAVILITNRPAVLDPALRRRVALQLHFDRPDQAAREALLATGLPHISREDRTSVASSLEGYTHSDIRDRLVLQAVRMAWQDDQPVGRDHLERALRVTRPSPRMNQEDLR